MPSLLNWEPRRVHLKAKGSLQGCQKWCSRCLHTGLRTRLPNVIGSHDFKGLLMMCLCAVEVIMELTVGCSSQTLDTVSVKVPGLTSLTSLTI